MTKKLLLAATAFTAMAFAGAASAAEITAVSIGDSTPVSLNLGASPTFYYLASSAVQPATATNFTAGAFNATLTAGTGATPVPLAVGTYSVRFDLTGSGTPVFNTAVAANDLSSNAGATTCAVSFAVVDGGGAGQNYVVAQATVSNVAGQTCGGADRPTSFSISKPIRISTAGTVSVGGSLSNVTGGGGTTIAAADRTATAKGVVKLADPYSVTAVASTTPTSLSLTSTPVYSAITTGGSNDANIGTVTYNTAAAPADAVMGAVFAGLAENALPATTATFAVTASGGDFSKLNATIGGTAATEVGAVATVATVSPGAAANVVLAADAGTPATTISTSPISFSAAITPAYAAGLADAAKIVTLPTAVSVPLQTLTLDGTNFVAPWFTLNNAANTAFLRLSNTGSTATGPITISLKAPNGAVSTASCTLTQAMVSEGTLSSGGIAANSAVLLTGPALASQCFGGTTVANGDLQVTIQGQATELTAKTRVRTAGGVVTETSLGRLGEASVTF